MQLPVAAEANPSHPPQGRPHAARARHPRKEGARWRGMRRVRESGRSLGSCLMGVPSPPFQAWTAAGEGGGGTEEGLPPTGRQSRTWKWKSTEGSGTAGTPGPALQEGTVRGPQCPWDCCSLRSPAGGPCMVAAHSGVLGLLPGAVWFLGDACPKGATSSSGPAWPLPCSSVPAPPSPGPRSVELPAGVLVLQGLPCVEGSFADAHLRLDPRCSRPGQSTAGASENKSPARRRALPAAGEDGFGSRTRPKPNSRPGGRGRGGGGAGGAELG